MLSIAYRDILFSISADAGLVKGKLGSGKKLTHDAIKDYKRIWEIELKKKTEYSS